MYFYLRFLINLAIIDFLKVQIDFFSYQLIIASAGHICYYLDAHAEAHRRRAWPNGYLCRKWNR